MVLQVHRNPREELVNISVGVTNRQKRNFHVLEHPEFDQQIQIAIQVLAFVLFSSIVQLELQDRRKFFMLFQVAYQNTVNDLDGCIVPLMFVVRNDERMSTSFGSMHQRPIYMHF